MQFKPDFEIYRLLKNFPGTYPSGWMEESSFSVEKILVFLEEEKKAQDKKDKAGNKSNNKTMRG